MTIRMFDYYWADPHFGHKRIIELCYRPFSSTEEMDDALIDNYNSYVCKDDTVAWLGDTFFMSVAGAKRIMDRLNGRKVLIWGGHDKSFSAMLRMGFSAVALQMDVLIADRVCTLCHFPYPSTRLHDTEEEDGRFVKLRPLKKRGQVLIHGHTHLKEKFSGTMIHVGVDAWDFKPVAHHMLETLVNKIYGGKR